jgi:hypothetical protein
MFLHITLLEGIRNVYNVNGLKSWRERSSAMSRDRFEDIIKTSVKLMQWKGVEWIHLAQKKAIDDLFWEG